LFKAIVNCYNESSLVYVLKTDHEGNKKLFIYSKSA